MAFKSFRPTLGALLLPILLALASPALAMGSRENPLAQADALIKSQKYDDAVLLLTDFIKNNPDRFDQAQTRLRKIVEIRNMYNREANVLLKSLIDDPRNEDKHLALIRKLEDLERFPNPDIQKFIEETKLTILFTKNRVILEDIMDQGQTFTGLGRFVEAARHYATGFELYRPEFEFGGYDPITVRSAFARIADVGTQIGRFAYAQPALTAAANSLRDAFASGSPARIDAALPAAEEALVALANLRTETIAAGEALQRQFEIFRTANPTLTDDSFLPFAFRFILGRTETAQPEGVAGAMAAEWAALFDASAGAADTDLARRYAQAEAAFASGDFTAANTGFVEVRDLAARALRFQGLWSIFLPTDVADPPGAFGRNLVATRGADYLRIQHLRDTAAAWASLATLRKDLADQVSRADETPAVAGAEAATASPESAFSASLVVLRGLKTRNLEIQKGIGDLDKAALARGEELARISASGFVPRGAAEVQADLAARIAESLDAAKAFEIRATALSAKAEVDIQEIRLAARTAAAAQARRLLEGATPPDAAPGSARLYYPTQSLQILSETDKLLLTLRRDVSDIVSRYSGETTYISSAPSVTQQIERARALDASAARLIEANAVMAAAARDRQRQAQSNRLEADRRYQEAQTALKREDFDTARERLDRARERYLASLSFEEDPDLRARSDANLQDLGVQLVRAENDRVVRDTRRLLTEGKALYNSGDFARAEEALIQARSRWKVTHTDEPEPEVEYWLRLVQTALSVKTGRDILQTAPLYPEMSQLLSLAKKNFEEGRLALEKRDKVSALQSFDAAKKRIQEIKIVFPLNQEARVLELRINQLSDPDAFNREFARLVNAARVKIDARQDLETTYGDLLDLAAIDPKYTGLRALIERLEILIGLRLPPPDPRALAEARSLTTAAQKTFDSREVARFPTALAQLNRALELDPNNQDASRLKDRILTYVGGTATLVLPSAGETLFNEAVTFFQNGDYLSSRIRLTRLYDAYPQARKVQKASDLDARLVARGYP